MKNVTITIKSITFIIFTTPSRLQRDGGHFITTPIPLRGELEATFFRFLFQLRLHLLRRNLCRPFLLIRALGISSNSPSQPTSASL